MSDDMSDEKISEIFRSSMESKEILPKNPFVSSNKMKGLAEWVASMGGKCHKSLLALGDARTRRLERLPGCTLIKVRCQQFRKGRKWVQMYVYIEIPWELAEKALILGFVP